MSLCCFHVLYALVDRHGDMLHEADLQFRYVRFLSVHHLTGPVTHGFFLQTHTRNVKLWLMTSVRRTITHFHHMLLFSHVI